MPTFNKQMLEVEAGKYGFRRDTFEKVVRLKRILEFMNSDEVLSNHLWLKGGTAINLTLFDFPRLSVDIDMDYTPNDEKAVMEETRQEIDRLLRDYMESEGYVLSDESRFMHSLDSYHYNYINAAGNKDMIKVEMQINRDIWWNNLNCPKKTEGRKFCDEDCSYRLWEPLELKMVLAHLIGEKEDCTDVIGVYPLFPDNTCRFLVFDFDNHEKDAYKNDDANTDDLWKSEVDALRRICKQSRALQRSWRKK